MSKTDGSKTEKPKMHPGDRLLSPRSVAKKMAVSLSTVYDLLDQGYFRRYYPNGPGRRPVRIWESSVDRHIEAFTLEEGVVGDQP